MPRIVNIAPERIKEALGYNPETGSLTWKKATAKFDRTGQEAAPAPAVNGYRYITIDKGDYLAQRLAWVIMTGEFPNGRITFKDGDKTNLKWGNLIECKPLCKAKFDHRTPEGRSAYGKEWRAKNPGLYKDKTLKSDFGIGIREYEAMIIEQNGTCAICKKIETTKRHGKDVALSVDHDHETGAVRGLLCVNCNNGLGQFKDKPEILEQAAAYLRIDREKQKDSNVISMRAKD